MHAEADLHPPRPVAALLRPFRWIWRTFWLVFGVSAPVPRSSYIIAGILFFSLRYGFETHVAHEHLGFWLRPDEFFTPYFARDSYLFFNGAGEVLVKGSLPFLWIGVTMSVRRAADAGLPPWLGFLFLVPGCHYVACLVLAILPTRSAKSDPRVGGPFREQLEQAPAPKVASVVYPGILVKAVVLGPLGAMLAAMSLGGHHLLFVFPAASALVAAVIYCMSATYQVASPEQRDNDRRTNGRLIAWCVSGLALTAAVLWLSSELLGIGALLVFFLVAWPALMMAALAFYCIAVTPWTRWL